MSAPPAVSQNENAENKSKVGAFVRHQFFRDHKASASAPAAVLVETRHKDSVAAAEYSHSRASELAVKIEAKLAAEKVDKDKQPLIDDSTCTSSQSQCTDRVDVGPVNNDRATALPTEGFSKFFLGDGSAPAHQKTLTALTLLGIMFCNSIGGGYGLENSVGSGGALITTLGVIFLPFIWAVPVAFVVAELSTSVPTNGGFLMWINVSMPAPVYFFAVINTLLLMFIDNAVYPVLFADYLCQSIECSDSLHTGMKIVALFVTFILNIVGVQAVGLATIFITFISITPFATMFVVHMAKTGGYINWDNMKSVPPDIDWVTLTSTLAWNVAGFEQAGCVAEDVKNPRRASPVPLSR